MIDTHILDGAIRKLAVPFVFNFRDFAAGLIIEDVDLAVDGLLFANAFNDVTCAKVHSNGIAAGGNFVVKALDLRKGTLQTIPLRFVLLAADSLSDWVFESAFVVP